MQILDPHFKALSRCSELKPSVANTAQS